MLLFLQLYSGFLPAVFAEFGEFTEIGLVSLKNANGVRTGVTVRTEAGVDSALSAGHSWESIRKNRGIAIQRKSRKSGERLVASG